MSSWRELTDNQLDSLSTYRLLAILKMARDGAWSTGSTDERIFNKIKDVLSDREHIGKPVRGIYKTGDPKMFKALMKKVTRGEMPKRERVGSIADPKSAIGKQVYKRSKKPFKSKQLYNTVSGVTTNPHTGLDAFTFEEDSSVVDCWICNIRKK